LSEQIKSLLQQNGSVTDNENEVETRNEVSKAPAGKTARRLKRLPANGFQSVSGVEPQETTKDAVSEPKEAAPRRQRKAGKVSVKSDEPRQGGLRK
jgi:hypothetical protein